MVLHRLSALTAIFLMAVASTACSDGNGPGGPSKKVMVEKLSGDQLTGIVGSSIEPMVRLTRDGEPVAEEVVKFTVLTGDGTLVDSLVTTNRNGTASAVWLLGLETGEQLLTASAGASSVEFTAVAELPEVGRSYFGRRDYVEFIPGDLPIILSSPHDGGIQPAEIARRTEGTFARDGNLTELTRRIAAAIHRLTGRHPHVAIIHLHRTRLDTNREIREAAQGNPHAIRTWHEYHTWLDIAGELASREYGRGLHLDLHGHPHPIQRIELGYMLGSGDLNRSDELLDSMQYLNKSSVRHLGTKSPLRFSEVIRGEDSFGEILHRNGYPAVPSKSDPMPRGEPFFSHGYTLERHGSRDGGTVDAIMLEHNRDLRETPETREAYAVALAATIAEFIATHMDIDITQGGPAN